MQITAVALWQTLRLWDPSWTLNLVCCYMPAWLLAPHVQRCQAGACSVCSASAERFCRALECSALLEVGGGFQRFLRASGAGVLRGPGLRGSGFQLGQGHPPRSSLEVCRRRPGAASRSRRRRLCSRAEALTTSPSQCPRCVQPSSSGAELSGQRAPGQSRPWQGMRLRRLGAVFAMVPLPLPALHCSTAARPSGQARLRLHGSILGRLHPRTDLQLKWMSATVCQCQFLDSVSPGVCLQEHGRPARRSLDAAGLGRSALCRGVPRYRFVVKLGPYLHHDSHDLGCLDVERFGRLTPSFSQWGRRWPSRQLAWAPHCKVMGRCFQMLFCGNSYIAETWCPYSLHGLPRPVSSSNPKALKDPEP